MEGKPDRPVLIVAGPTASGKSALALDVAAEFDGVVINADSMQVYAELRILTARPDETAAARVPHRLYGVLPATEVCSAARWRDMAIEAIADAHRDDQLPILCGGTGLYLRALMQGLSPIPEIPEGVRKNIRDQLEEEGPSAQFERLRAVDPETADRLAPGDRQRVARALEVQAETGRPLSAWLAVPPDGPPPGMCFKVVLLAPPRETLYARCDERLLQMVAQGALEEVGTLHARGVDPSRPAMRALGVPAFLRHLNGEVNLEDAVAEAQQATRRYAKRQMTWFRHQIITNLIVQTQYSEKNRPEIFSFIRQNLLTRPD